MPKLTIDEKDYYTEDFNEEQKKVYAEIQAASSEISRMDYVMQVLQARTSFLAGQIVDLADKEEAPAEE